MNIDERVEIGEDPPKTRGELLEMWERGWKCMFDALEPLTEADLGRKVTIRTEPHSVMQAINRQIAHYSYHVGQIVYVGGTSLATNGRPSPSQKRNRPSSTGKLARARSRSAIKDRNPRINCWCV
jgi:Protein of unknown function (DUF1572)